MNDQLKSLKISLHIPPEYHQQPVIFRLASDYNLEVNITSALLGESAGGDGWFNLLLKGTKEAIAEGLNYLADSKIEVWNHSKEDQIFTKDWDFEGWLLED
jgi:hypothetical protein